jgi:spermidine/putrescine transport system permease protein
MAEARAGSALDGRRGVFGLLLAPPLVVLGLLLLAPLGLMLAISLRPDLSGPVLEFPAPTLAHYEQLAATPGFVRLLGTSIVIAAVVAALATALAYPVAYFLRFRAGDRAALYLLLLLVPFWASYLLRVISWRMLLGADGAINSFLVSAGVVAAPIEELLYRFAVVVTLVYVWIPFAALPILGALQRVEAGLHDAAADLYATPRHQLLRVTLPLSMPGVLAAFFMVFIPTVGEYVTPLLVGGVGGTMYGNLIYDLFSRAANWPYGAALSVVMLVTTLALAAVAVRLINLGRLVPR